MLSLAETTRHIKVQWLVNEELGKVCRKAAAA